MFYTQNYIYLIMAWDNLWLKLCLIVCAKVFDVVVIFMHYKMIHLDSITNENNKEHNEKLPYIPDHPYKILIIGSSGSGKTKALLNLINEQNNIDKICLYARDLSKPKYEYFIKTRENAGIKHLNDPNAFIECSNTMGDIRNNINDYNPIKKRKISIVFDDMIEDISTNKKSKATIIELVVENWIFDLLLLHSIIFLFQKMSD